MAMLIGSTISKKIEYEFEDVFENVHAINTKSFPIVFKLRVIEMYKQHWWNSVKKSTVMDVYKIFLNLHYTVSPKPPKGILYSRVRALYLSGCRDGHGGYWIGVLTMCGLNLHS